jgi:hypothetical protein
LEEDPADQDAGGQDKNGGQDKDGGQDKEQTVLRVDALGVKDPLDVTAAFLDAQERAKLWSPSAVLSGIELVVESGKPKGPITFEFGEAVGQAIPGVPLSPKRYTLAYEDKNVKEESSDSSTGRVGLPEPNCPLEVAFRTLAQSDIGTHGRIGILYTHSQKHGKPVWLVTDEQSQTTSLNADNCALLRR